MNKSNFKTMVQGSGRQTDFLSDRQWDYRYLEFKLFLLLDDYREFGDFSELGLPESLSDYDICSKTPVTLNAELYRFYDCGYYYFVNDFIDHVLKIIKHYVNGQWSIDSIVRYLRAERLKFKNELIN